MTPTYAEPLLGWRLWHVDRDHRLLSWSQDAHWPERGQFEARCRRLLGRCDGAPRRGHACGIYALRTRELAEALVRQLPAPVTGAIALGRVSLWGRVIENVDGWRAQFAYPYDIELLGGDEGVARELRRRYAIDVALALSYS
jgi:hypothetical protein